MKELVINQPSKHILRMLQKMVGLRDYPLEKLSDNTENKLCYEILQKGTYTACILTINNEIVGLGMTKRDRKDKYNTRVAVDVSVHKAIKDYLFGIEPEYLHLKNRC